MHDEKAAEQCGAAGTRDAVLLASAPARPGSLALCGKADVADRVAAHGCGMAGNHPFSEGNKRTAFVVAEFVLLQDGQELLADDGDSMLAMLAVAAGTPHERAFAT